jgi:hypothetical protein
VVLLPLAELRGLESVRIEGTITEVWASWLERAMGVREVKIVPEFEFQPEAKEAIRKLKGEATLEER